MKNRESFGASRLLCVALVAALALGLAAQSMWADELYSRIRGVVSDPSGAVLAGVQLTATNVATGVQKGETTGADGSYEFFNLAPGTYNLKATKQGFRAYHLQKITVVVTQIYVASFKMEIGAATEVVQVEANPVQVETTSSQLGNTVSGNLIVNLPLINRNWTQLQATLPGVSAADRFGTYSTNGSQSQQNSYLINGTDSNDIALNTPAVIPNADAIAEVQMVTNTINPEYGRNSGAIMNAVTKSGSNDFHGSAFDFFRDTSLNTKPYFGTTPGIYHQNMFGGTVGGPIKKEKAFFFFGYQGYRNRRAQSTANNTVFSDAQRAGDFGVGACPAGFATIAPIQLIGYNGTVHPANTTSYCTAFRNPTTGQIFVDPRNFNPISKNLMNTYVPHANSGATGYLLQAMQKGSSDEWQGRTDLNLTPQDQLWVYFLGDRQSNVRDLPFTGATLLGFGDQAITHRKNATLAYTHSFNPETLNEVRVGWIRFNYAAVMPQKIVQPKELGFTGITPAETSVAGAPYVSITGMFRLGFSVNGPQPRIDTNYQFTDNFSKVAGKHTLKMGFDMRRFQQVNPFYFYNNGGFDFAGNGEFSSGDAGLDFLLGVPDGFYETSPGIIDMRAREYYSYFQDQWKVKSNLTLTFGTGWQIDTPMYNQAGNDRWANCFIPGQQSTVYPTAPRNLNFVGDKGCNTAGGPTTKYAHFGPRFGFAYSPDWGWISGGPGKMSIRGGYGIYYNRFEGETTLQDLGAVPFSIASSGVYDVGGSPGFANPWVDIAGRGSLNNKFPYVPPTAGAPVDFSIYYPMSLNYRNPNMTVPYAQNFNLTIQREIPAKMVVTTAYVGSLGRKLLTAIEMNQNPNIAAAAANPTCVAHRTALYWYCPQYFTYNPRVFGGIGVQDSRGTSNYNAFQLTVDKAPTHGLDFRLAYTWSRSLDEGSNLEDNGWNGHGNYYTNLRPDYGNSSFDARQRLVVTYGYEVPNLHNIASVLPNKVFGGWRLGGITTFQTGNPIAIYDGGARSLLCSGYQYYSCPAYTNYAGPFITYDPRGSTVLPNGQPNTSNLWFNASTTAGLGTTSKSGDPVAFNRVPIGTLGNMRRNQVYGPGYQNFDFMVAKRTSITEGKDIELRFEFFNLFNHTNFSNPTSNMNSTTFGRITTAGDPRLVQLAAKFYF